MAYKMRFHVKIRLVQPQNAEAVGAVGDPTLLEVGDTVTDIYADPPGVPVGPIITSLTAAVAAAMGVNRRIQSGLKTNVRFQVYGKPVGHPEQGATDIPAEGKAEYLYITGDTPNPLLLFWIARANRKPYVPAAPNNGFIPADNIPEAGDLDDAQGGPDGGI